VQQWLGHSDMGVHNEVFEAIAQSAGPGESKRDLRVEGPLLAYNNYFRLAVIRSNPERQGDSGQSLQLFRLHRNNPAVEAGWLPVSCRHRQLLLRLVHSEPCVLLLLDRGERFHAIEAHRHEEIDGTS